MNFAYRSHLAPELIPQRLLDVVNRYPLRIRKPVWGRYVGRHPSMRAGAGQEFRSHLAYTPGDDLRLLDWRAVARRDRLILRQTEAEDELSVVILVDATAGMSYGEKQQVKSTIAFALAAALATTVFRQGDRLGFAVLDGDSRHSEQLKPSSVPRRLHQFFHQLHLCQTRGLQGLCRWSETVKRTQHHLPRRSLVLLISDFLAVDEQGLLSQLASLRARSHNIHLIQVLHRDELTFPWTSHEMLRFDDLCQAYPSITGTGQTLRKQYITRIQHYLQNFRRGCEQNGLGVSTFISDEDVEVAYLRLLQQISGTS